MTAPVTRALTLWRPWPWAILNGKPVENRDWLPPAAVIGTRIAIHAGKRCDSDEAATFVMDRLRLAALPRAALDEGIVGIAKLVGAIEETANGWQMALGDWGSIAPPQAMPWFVGRYGWLLDEVQALPAPIPCSGAQGLWTLPPDVAARVNGLPPPDAAEGAHHCHARGCNTPCEPERLMCLRHWRMVPKALQAEVWATYRPGQCDLSPLPSREWHDAADAAIRAVAEREAPADAKRGGTLL